MPFGILRQLIEIIFLQSQAAKFGDVVAVKNHFLSAKSEKFTCNQLDEHQMSPLHYAARDNRADVVSMLIDHGAGNFSCAS